MLLTKLICFPHQLNASVIFYSTRFLAYSFDYKLVRQRTRTQQHTTAKYMKARTIAIVDALKYVLNRKVKAGLVTHYFLSGIDSYE